jgi:hypothetical protein
MLKCCEEMVSFEVGFRRLSVQTRCFFGFVED